MNARGGATGDEPIGTCILCGIQVIPLQTGYVLQTITLEMAQLARPYRCKEALSAAEHGAYCTFCYSCGEQVRK